VGKSISEESMRKLLNFLRENKDYQVLVGTDRAQETQQVIDRVCEHDIAAKECFNRAKICHVNDWMPKDDEKTGDIAGQKFGLSWRRCADRSRIQGPEPERSHATG
jgi:hypothetical protein